MYKYKTIDTRTIKGIKQAERLQANDWKIIRSGLFSIQFEKKIGKK